MIKVECGNCLTMYKLRPELAGKKVKCKKCGEAISVPRRRKRRPASEGDRPAPSRTRKPRSRREPAEDEDYGYDDYGDNFDYDFGYTPAPRGLPPKTVKRKKPKSPVRSGKRRRKHREGMSPYLIGSMIGFGFILIGSVLGFAIADLGEMLGPVYFITGWGIMAICNIWILSIAFGEEAICGILCLFMPFYSLYYVITRFDETRYAILTWFIGVITFVIGLVMSALHVQI